MPPWIVFVGDGGSLKHTNFPFDEDAAPEVQLEAEKGNIPLPWYDAFKNKAYIQDGESIAESIGIIPGENGIALACFKHAPPTEIPGLSNDAIQGAGDTSGRPAKEEWKRCLKRPASDKKEKEEATEEDLPEGWRVDKRVRRSGVAKGQHYLRIHGPNPREHFSSISAALCRAAPVSLATASVSSPDGSVYLAPRDSQWDGSSISR